MNLDLIKLLPLSADRIIKFISRKSRGFLVSGNFDPSSGWVPVGEPGQITVIEKTIEFPTGPNFSYLAVFCQGMLANCEVDIAYRISGVTYGPTRCIGRFGSRLPLPKIVIEPNSKVEISIKFVVDGVFSDPIIVLGYITIVDVERRARYE